MGETLMSIELERNILVGLVGCRIRTHYKTGGVVHSFSGPYELPEHGRRWTVVYEQSGGGFGYLNTIEIAQTGQVLCEGKCLEVIGRERDVQMNFF